MPALIYYLLQAGEVSHWHRVNDADEIWLFQAGSPLELTLSPEGERREDHRLGTDVANGEEPQILVARRLASRRAASASTRSSPAW